MANFGRFDFYTACSVNGLNKVIVVTCIDDDTKTFSISPNAARRFADDLLRAANEIDPIEEEVIEDEK